MNKLFYGVEEKLIKSNIFRAMNIMVDYLMPKDCPNCGSKTNVIRSSGIWRYWVRCSNPECRTHSKIHGSVIDAVFTWNNQGVKSKE